MSEFYIYTKEIGTCSSKSYSFVPGQPVVDLETYMGSLEKRQQTLNKMIEELAKRSDDASMKLCGCMGSKEYIQRNNLHLYHNVPIYLTFLRGPEYRCGLYRLLEVV